MSPAVVRNARTLGKAHRPFAGIAGRPRAATTATTACGKTIRDVEIAPLAQTAHKDRCLICWPKETNHE